MLLTKKQLYYKIGNILSHIVDTSDVDFSEDEHPYRDLYLSENDALIDELADFTIDFERPIGTYDDVKGCIRAFLYELEGDKITFKECLLGIVQTILDYRYRILTEGR